MNFTFRNEKKVFLQKLSYRNWTSNAVIHECANPLLIVFFFVIPYGAVAMHAIPKKILDQKHQLMHVNDSNTFN